MGGEEAVSCKKTGCCACEGVAGCAACCCCALGGCSGADGAGVTVALDDAATAPGLNMLMLGFIKFRGAGRAPPMTTPGEFVLAL